MSVPPFILRNPQSLPETETARIVEGINTIYLEEEGVVWPDDGTYTRIRAGAFKSMCRKGEIILAWDTEKECSAGLIKVYRFRGEWYFGMLVTFSEYRGKGLGRMLIEAAESQAQEAGAQSMWIELLFVDGVHLPRKTFLREWYSGMGYRFMEKVPFRDRGPASYEAIMKRPCYFEVMRKILGSPGDETRIAQV